MTVAASNCMPHCAAHTCLHHWRAFQHLIISTDSVPVTQRSVPATANVQPPPLTNQPTQLSMSGMCLHNMTLDTTSHLSYSTSSFFQHVSTDPDQRAQGDALSCSAAVVASLNPGLATTDRCLLQSASKSLPIHLVLSADAVLLPRLPAAAPAAGGCQGVSMYMLTGGGGV